PEIEQRRDIDVIEFFRGACFCFEVFPLRRRQRAGRNQLHTYFSLRNDVFGFEKERMVAQFGWALEFAQGDTVLAEKYFVFHEPEVFSDFVKSTNRLVI